MLNKIILAGILFLGFSIDLSAQVTGFVDDFNDGNINGWVSDHSATFQLSHSDNALKIKYTRTSSSGLWDNFNFTPPSTININSKPIITFSIKSNVNTVFSIKPTNGQEVPLITQNIIGDGAWRKMTFEVNNTNSKIITKMYLYFDGGTSLNKNGEIFLDDISFGDSAKFALNYDELEFAINSAQKLIANTVEGNDEGDYFTGSKLILQSKINIAKEFINAHSEDPVELETAIWNLYDACVNYETSVHSVDLNLVDKKSTKQTRYLFLNMETIAESSLMFGMHDATGYGVGWSGDNDRSDIFDIVGDYPAIFSEDINQIQNNRDIEGVKYRLSSAYNGGGIITMCWHQYDPDGRGFYKEDVNNERIVATILPGGSRHEQYKTLLRKIAGFFKSLRGANGESIPVIFRPYHEHTGGWFWWGAGHRTTEEYNAIWQFTVEYLRDELNVHNLLYALSPSLEHVYSGNQYLATYPGDNYVDIFGTDKYFSRNPVPLSEKDEFLNGMKTIVQHAKQRDKLAALTEVGNELLVINNWFTDILLEPIKNDELARNISYAAVWRNASTSHHFAPFPGHSSVPDFIRFYNDPYVLFESSLPDMYSIPKEDISPPFFTSAHDTILISISEDVLIEVKTDERAFLKFGYTYQSFDLMPFSFSHGEGKYTHSTTITGKQGETKTIYVQARDVLGNTTSNALAITFMVDTLRVPIAWNENRYPSSAWSVGAAPIGSNSGVKTISAEVKTLYVRKEFDFAELPATMAFLIKCQGGAAIYLNGKEIERINLPADSILSYSTKATSSASVNKIITFDATELSYFEVGKNTFAVEVHAPAGSYVGSFDGRVFNAKGIIADLGSQWSYYDEGNRPANVTLGDIVGITFNDPNIPVNHVLYQNYPNPFNPSTRIRYEIARGTDVTLDVFDILGRKVLTLVDEFKNAGRYEIIFDGKNLASGVYTLRLSADNYKKAEKMILLK